MIRIIAGNAVIGTAAILAAGYVAIVVRAVYLTNRRRRQEKRDARP